MGQYESYYKTVVGDQTYWLGEHIGRGSSKDPVNTIRIAFHWDKGTAGGSSSATSANTSKRMPPEKSGE